MYCKPTDLIQCIYDKQKVESKIRFVLSPKVEAESQTSNVLVVMVSQWRLSWAQNKKPHKVSLFEKAYTNNFSQKEIVFVNEWTIGLDNQKYEIRQQSPPPPPLSPQPGPDWGTSHPGPG